MADLPNSIVKELRECGPLDVKQLMDKLGRPRKDINRMLYDMEKRKIIEQVDNDGRKGPPPWQLRQDHVTPVVPSNAGLTLETHEQPKLIPAESSLINSPSGSSTSVSAAVGGSIPSTSVEQDEERRQQVLHVLRESREPISALTIARRLGLTGKRDVNPVLFKLKEEVLVKMIKSDSKPLWQLVGGSANIPTSQTSHMSSGADVATWDRNLLYTLEGSVGEPITLKPVKKNDILNRASQSGSTCNHGNDATNRTNEVPRVPIQESTDDNTPKVKEKAKINPINLSNSAQIQIPEFDQDTLAQPNVNPSTEDELKTEMKMMSLLEAAPVSTVTNNGTKKVKKMAARFPPALSETTPTEQSKILELLTQNTTMSTEQVSIQLGMATRAPAYEMLEKLEHDKKVQRSKVDGINLWSLADDD